MFTNFRACNLLEVSARDRYKRKLEYDDGDSELSDLYFMQHGWQNDPSQWLDLTFDIYHYLNNTLGMFSRTSMKAYKSG